MFSVVFTKLIGRLVRCYNYTICASPVVSSAAILIYSVFILFFFSLTAFWVPERHAQSTERSQHTIIKSISFISFVDCCVVDGGYVFALCGSHQPHNQTTQNITKVSIVIANAIVTIPTG